MWIGTVCVVVLSRHKYTSITTAQQAPVLGLPVATAQLHHLLHHLSHLLPPSNQVEVLRMLQHKQQLFVEHLHHHSSAAGTGAGHAGSRDRATEETLSAEGVAEGEVCHTCII